MCCISLDHFNPGFILLSIRVPVCACLGCSSVGRTSDWHVADVDSIPLLWQGIFLPESTIRADSFTASVHPRVQSHACTSVRLLKILQVVHVTRVWWIIIIIIIIIYPLPARVVWALQMISQPVFSIFPCSPLPSWTCRTPGLSIP